MTYQALAIQYRPQSFADFTGQESTVTALRNALNNKQLHHAYLFSGTRGVGKTTLARLLSKCLNCEQGISAEPCQTCAGCVDMTGGRHMDLIEIDAASRTKVEDTRELLDNVPYAASSGNFKIYLIDEVHMLSKHSFNALLKTLEEPPAHVKFILATTEPEKIPSTIRSRCLHFALTKISHPQLMERLAHVLDKQQINFEQQALTSIATAANGSLRDALSLLDKAIAYANGALDVATVATALGLDQADTSYQLITCLAQNDVAATLALTTKLAEHGHDFTEQLRTLCKLFQQVAAQQMLARQGHNISTDQQIQDLSKLFEPAQIQLYYQIALDAQKDMAYAPTPHTGFDMTLLRMLAFEPQAHTASKPQAQTATPAQPQQAPTTTTTTTATAKATAQQQKHAPLAAKAAPTPHQPMTSIQQRWLQMVDQLALGGMSQQAVQHCQCQNWSNDQLKLSVEPKHAPLLSEKQQANIQKAIQQHLNSNIAITFNFTPLQASTATPAQVKQQAHEKNQQSAAQKIQQDDCSKALMDQLDATLIPESVTINERKKTTNHVTTGD